ncbi:MAG: SDR family oxidoreductase [Eubacteriales bacterium]
MQVKEMFNLEGRVAVVTGGSIGLGEQMCTVLAEAGASVVVTSRKLERCEELAGKLRGLGARALGVKCDVSKSDEVESMVNAAVSEFGRLDILINNAGVTWGALAEDYPIDRWQKLLDVNVTGTFLCCQKAGKVMIGQKYGKIINLSSICGFVGNDPEVMHAIGYHTSKGAVIAFTRDLAAKWAQYGINVNAISPGWFPTHMTKHVLKEKGEMILRHIPMRRFGSGEDIKGAALFLASPASDYITGHVLRVDGGYLAV